MNNTMTAILWGGRTDPDKQLISAANQLLEFLVSLGFDAMDSKFGEEYYIDPEFDINGTAKSLSELCDEFITSRMSASRFGVTYVLGAKKSDGTYHFAKGNRKQWEFSGPWKNRVLQMTDNITKARKWNQLNHIKTTLSAGIDIRTEFSGLRILKVEMLPGEITEIVE